MNSTEKLDAAIEKLGTLKARSTQGPWSVDGSEVVRDASGLATVQSLWVADIDPEVPDAELIVTLHRTIDAQLDFLDAARSMKGVYREIDGEVVSSRFGHCALALADAILGES